jgi:hypothetical protein
VQNEGSGGQPCLRPCQSNEYQHTLHAHEEAPADHQENYYGTAKRTTESTAARHETRSAESDAE